MDDFYDLLSRCEAFQHLGALGPRFNAGDEVTGHAEIDVGLQQRAPDLAQGLVDVLVGQPTFAGQPVKYPGQPVRQVVKHCISPSAL